MHKLFINTNFNDGMEFTGIKEFAATADEIDAKLQIFVSAMQNLNGEWVGDRAATWFDNVSTDVIPAIQRAIEAIHISAATLSNMMTYFEQEDRTAAKPFETRSVVAEGN
jgi:uncharacterized protein YukE